MNLIGRVRRWMRWMPDPPTAKEPFATAFITRSQPVVPEWPSGPALYDRLLTIHSWRMSNSMQLNPAGRYKTADAADRLRDTMGGVAKLAGRYLKTMALRQREKNEPSRSGTWTQILHTLSRTAVGGARGDFFVSVATETFGEWAVCAAVHVGGQPKCEPEVIVEKVIELLDGVTAKSGKELRDVISNLTELLSKSIQVPLKTPERR